MPRAAKARAIAAANIFSIHLLEARPVEGTTGLMKANVSFFPSAAAAEVAGFRPCLRCRPETAPFCSAWIGSRATVERGLRLIVKEGGLDQDRRPCSNAPRPVSGRRRRSADDQPSAPCSSVRRRHDEAWHGR